MAYGLRVRDAAGNIILDITDRVGTVLGVATITGGVNGYVTNAGFAEGAPFWMATALATYSTRSPGFAFDAGLNRLSWDWGGASGVDHKLVYGVY